VTVVLQYMARSGTPSSGEAWHTFCESLQHFADTTRVDDCAELQLTTSIYTCVFIGFMQNLNVYRYGDKASSQPTGATAQSSSREKKKKERSGSPHPATKRVTHQTIWLCPVSVFSHVPVNKFQTFSELSQEPEMHSLLAAQDRDALDKIAVPCQRLLACTRR